MKRIFTLRVRQVVAQVWVGAVTLFFAFMAGYPAVCDENELRVTCSVKRDQYYAREPIAIELLTTNLSSKPAYPVSRTFAFYISRDNGDWKKVLVYRTREEEMIHFLPAPYSPKLLQGESGSQRQWIILVKCPKSDNDREIGIKFAFEEEGRYKVNLTPSDNGAAQFSIVKVSDPGFELFDKVVAMMFLGESGVALEHAALAEELLKKHPRSVYAPYAAMALWVFHEKRQQRSYSPEGEYTWPVLQWFHESLPYIDFVIDNAPPGPLHEDALWRKCKAILRAVGYEKSSIQLAESYKRCISILEKNYPQSSYLSELCEDPEKWDRWRTVPELKPVAKRVGVQRFVTQGLEKIEKDARHVFEAFLQAMASEKVEDVAKFLASDFEWEIGDANSFMENIREVHAKVNIDEESIVVKEAIRVSSHERKVEGKAKIKSYVGNIWIIRGERKVRWTFLETGISNEEKYPAAEWGLIKHEKDWKVAWVQYEEPYDGPSLELLDAITKQIWEGFSNWRISDGMRERCPFEEVLPRLGFDGEIKAADVEYRLEGYDTPFRGSKPKYYVTIWRRADFGRKDRKARRIEITLRPNARNDAFILDDVKVGDWTHIPRYPALDFGK